MIKISSFITLFISWMVTSQALSAAATMSSQFKLNPYDRDVSICWLACNMQVTYALPRPGNKPNAENLIDFNCGWSDYLDAMALCLPARCDSVNDVAYAVEFGQAFCKKAGVDARVRLDDSYTSVVGGYFATDEYKQWNSAYFERSAASLRSTVPAVLFSVIVLATTLFNV